MIKWHPLPASLPPTHPAVLIACFLGSGRLTPASGTWGSAAGLLMAMVVCQFFPSTYLLYLSAIFYALGIWACRVWLAHEDDKDPQIIVIDEVAGLCLCLGLIPFSPLNFFLGFCLFRFFDILKPWPISLIDRKLSGATGIMLDDMLAGLWAVLTFIAVQIIII